MEEKLKLQAFGMSIVEEWLLSKDARERLEIAAAIYSRAIKRGEIDEFMKALADVMMTYVVRFEAAWEAIEANEEDKYANKKRADARA